MSAENFFQLYSSGSDPGETFLLSEGFVYFFVSDADKYVIKGNNLIVGATELILKHLADMPVTRIETAVTEAGVKIKKIPADKFIASINNYSIIFNVSTVIAKQVLLTNQIINKNLGSLEGDEKKYKDLSIEYYRIVSLLKKEYDKRKYPWLLGLVEKYQNSLLCKRGESFDRSAEPTRISTPLTLADKILEFPKDSIICEEGSIGNEMYILQSGMIDVIIGGNRVASVSDQGYVFGEIALLLGEKRTATLKAKNNVVITRIQKSDLREVAASQGEVLTALVTSLAKKHYYNTEKINTINHMIIEKKLSAESQEKGRTAFDLHRSSSELYALKKDVTDVYTSKNAEFLKNLVDNF